ncbi:MAG: sensor histidine kinase [Planctomycetes bacterium]|nr:sensor histidine kinase [Planctomycetota bacterium]
MEHQPHSRSQSRRIPTWALVLSPILAVVVSNADVVLLSLTRSQRDTGDLTLALATTIPLSLGACGLTLWFLMRLRREVDRRTQAELETRASLADLASSLDREQLLRRELDHRVRNNLSALLALVGMYEDSQATTSEVVDSLRNKVLALRESFSLIATTHGEGVELDELLRAVVGVVAGGKANAINISGPSVRLTSREANAFAMIAQELLTNASKHGALRHADGAINISWQSAVVAKSVRVNLHWDEGPIPPIPAAEPDTQSGLGLTLIQRFAESDLRGGVRFARADNRWTVDLVANIKIVEPAQTLRTPQEMLV